MKRYRVGIDLGTTNTVVAYAEHGSRDIRLFDIEQLTAPGEVKAAPLLPSLRFHAAPGELAAGELQLPWSAAQDQAPHSGQTGPVVVGALARKLGAQVPGRLVASAKSWLSHAAVDRLAPILPWGAGDDVLKVSPVDASASYLAHVRAAWNHRFPDAPLERQDIVLTVPASFDESARALTVRAAAQAGLGSLRLLEEPQAAFYDWVFRHRADLATQLAQTRLVLVCDVGGGTTDLSLIKVELQEQDGEPRLTRIGVGKHLMLGGDNMDLVLAHMVESRMQGEGGSQRRLSATELSQLLERCRGAKEQLLAAQGPEKVAVTLLGAGSRLIGGSRSVELTREEAARIVVDGFFPMVAADAPVQQRRSGIVEFGLPYASDPAVTRHLAAFLAQFAAAAREALGMPEDGAAPAIPDTLLLNGGVFRAPALASRLCETLAGWRGQELNLLHNENPDVAVARGAVAFALAREGLAPRIGGGSPRSYFLMLDEPGRASPARPGAATENSPALRAVCVLPKGSEQGRELLLEDRVFALRLGRPVLFHLMSSTVDAGKRAPLPGEVVELAPGDLVPLPPIATVLPAGTGAGAGTNAVARTEVPVRLATALTEVGTLEMHCVSTEDAQRRWLLEFQLRGEQVRDGARGDATPAAGAGAAAGAESRPAPPGAALERKDRNIRARAQKTEPREVRQLRAQLEKLIGGREQWSTPVLRKLFDALLQRARARRRSADHERVWLNLAGYCLRPGFGYPLDDWRIDQLWTIFDAGIQYVKESQVATEWWTLWRRVAGGLDNARQLRLLDDFAFNVQDDEAALRDRPPHLVAGSYDDMLRLAGSLERIPASYKAEIGDWLLGLLDGSAPLRRNAAAPADSLVLWTLARIGARRPFYGNAHEVVAPDIALPWLEKILALDWKRVDGAALAAAHIARATDDRARDLPAQMRERVVQRLRLSGAAPAWAAMVEQAVELDEVSQRGFLGDSLPPGLKLIA